MSRIALNMWLLMMVALMSASCATPVPPATTRSAVEAPSPTAVDPWSLATEWLATVDSATLSGLGASPGVERLRWTGSVYEVVVVGERPDEDEPALHLTIARHHGIWRVTEVEPTSSTAGWPVF